jgi:intracellular sulfur oxidation DsrE/DsrF family protein
MKTLLVTSAVMGSGDDALGALLMEKFFTLLAEAPAVPETVFFYNTGVRLCAEGSPILPYLRALRGRGVELLACGTCVDHFGTPPIPKVEVSTMKTLLALLAEDPGTIRL